MEKDRKGRTLSKSARKSSSGKHHLSDEERSLWEHAASNLRPLKQREGRVQVGHEDTLEKPPRRPEASQKPAPKGTAERSVPGHSAKQSPAKSAPPPSQLDRRKARKISSGRIEIEARIDLHGMRQREAHSALRRFLLNAHAKGQRWVLVITGKGIAPRANSEAYEYAGLREEERGVIKRNVPRWLAEPQLRAIIISFAPATARHGGEGALYIQLRKRARAGPEY
jgi:DNA-nicking Smr family endonuclease